MAPGVPAEAGPRLRVGPRFLKDCCSRSFSHYSSCPEQCSSFSHSANSV